MRKIKSLSLTIFLLGIAFCIYGWLQLSEFSAHSSVYKYMYMKRIAKQYVFLVTGGAMILIGWTIDKLSSQVSEEFNVLYNKVLELEKKLEESTK